jgi:ATP-dependent DNA ligase
MEWSIPRRPALLPAGFVEPCMPSVRPTAPRGREWVHEIKHDGYRLIVRCEGKRARVFTRRGFDWTGRFRWIEDALLSLKAQSAVLDGEAVWCGHDGISSFETALAIVQRPSLSIRIRSACTEYRRLSLPTAKERNGKLEEAHLRLPMGKAAPNVMRLDTRRTGF